MNKSKERGITLIVLIMTIVLILILTGVSMRVLLDDDVIGKTQNTIDKANEKTVRENNLAENMQDEWMKNPEGIKSGNAGNLEDNYEESLLLIESSLENYKTSFPFVVVYSVEAKLNDEVIYSDIFESEFAGNGLQGNGIYMIVGAEVTIKPIFYSTSYKQKEGETSATLVIQKEEEANVVSFGYTYDGGNRYSVFKVHTVELEEDSEGTINQLYFSTGTPSYVYGPDVEVSLERYNDKFITDTYSISESPLWVRTYILAPEGIETKVTDKNDKWSKSADGVWYYLSPLPSYVILDDATISGSTTSELEIQIEVSEKIQYDRLFYFQGGFHLIAVSEVVDVSYDDKGYPIADWDLKSE